MVVVVMVVVQVQAQVQECAGAGSAGDKMQVGTCLLTNVNWIGVICMYVCRSVDLDAQAPTKP